MIAIVTTVMRALATYGTAALKEMIQNCMAQDLSWKVSTMMTAEFLVCRHLNFNCMRSHLMWMSGFLSPQCHILICV